MQTTANPLAALVQAVAFAADKHRNQRRKDAEASPYINHPIALANVLANEGGGDKSTQTVDIAASVQLARLFKE
jgi:(p)ppGpp synthase/HD superfamily hydrolase